MNVDEYNDLLFDYHRAVEEQNTLRAEVLKSMGDTPKSLVDLNNFELATVNLYRLETAIDNLGEHVLVQPFWKKFFRK